MSRVRPARRRQLFSAVAAAALAGAAIVAGCNSSSSGNTLVGSILAPSFKTSPQADISGQSDVFTGDLGSGVTFTFAALRGVTYNLSVTTTGKEDLVFDVFSRGGAQLKGKGFTANPSGGIAYYHDAESQFVLVLLRPDSIFNRSVTVNSLRVTGIGTYSQSQLTLNIIVAGDDFTGFGNFNDLATANDRADLAAALAQRFQTIHNANSTGITVTFEGFTLSTSQVQSQQGALVDGNGKTICRAQAEKVGSTGYAEIDTADLDRWGSFGFPSNDPVVTRANALDVFVVHHFASDGVVGLSPRPGGTIRGNGAGSCLVVGAFLQQNGTATSPRSLDDMGVVMTHEIGHFLGLLHTTTFSPTPGIFGVKEAIDDGLDDTLAPGTLADGNGDGVVGVGDGCADEPNVMFYQSRPAQQLFSPKQINVMKLTLSALEH